MNKTYWTMKNGQMIDVDEMDENHLRNTLKMILNRNKKNIFKLNGDIAKQFNESQEMDELFRDLEAEYNAEDFGCK